MKIQYLSLFGGIDAGQKAFENIGIPHKLIDYVEIDEKAVRTCNKLYERKHKPQSVVGWNLRPDILVHGSPCQDFSRAGKRLGGKDEDKTRSSLMWETIKIIKNFGIWKPRVVIWENVKGVLDKDMIHSYNKYLIEMDKLGYKNSFKVLNAMDFGIPQRRERIFTISILGNNFFDFNKLKTRKLRDINEFLENKVDDKYTIKSPSMLAKIKSTNNTNFKGYLQVVQNFVWTITTYQDRCPNSGIVDLKNGKYRLLTERECWRLMGFSDKDYEKALSVHPGKDGFKNNILYHQAGNSIVVPILEEIFKTLIDSGFINSLESEVV